MKNYPKKYVLISVALVVLIFYLLTANFARLTSNQILTKFDSVNNTLVQNSYDRDREKIDPTLDSYPSKNEILNTIGNLKEYYLEFKNDTALIDPYRDKSKEIGLLLNSIVQYNAWRMSRNIPEVFFETEDGGNLNEHNFKRFIQSNFTEQPVVAARAYLLYIERKLRRGE